MSYIISLKRQISIENRQKIRSIVKWLPKLDFLNHISKDTQNQWQKPSKSYDIINFSVIAWNYRYQRPQQLGTQLAKLGHRVFYIHNEFTPQIFSFNNQIKVKNIANNIFNVTLSASNNKFIYTEKLSKKDKKIILNSLKNLIKSANITNPVAKIDHPFWAQIADELCMPDIYDCMDSHQGFSNNAPHIPILEKELFTKANTTIVTSNYLQNIAKNNHAQNISLIQNAGDYSHFSQKQNTIPSDIKNIPHPIIGYYGAIDTWFDTDILESLAKNHKDKSIVLIGLLSNQKVITLSQKYKNIYILGEKPYAVLPQYLHQFDVCIIPFVLNDLIKATHPVKIFEYLAAGKPVVSTMLPEILDLKKLVHFADKQNFSNQINIALADKNVKPKQIYAKANTWATRATALDKLINATVFPKVSVVILSYNSPKLIKQTLDSVINQSNYPNLEIIVVDNNSNQETINLLKKYKNIKLVLNKTNYGFAKGNNIGMRASTGDYIILLNNDVIVTPGWVSRLLFHCRKNNVGLVGPVTNSIGNEAKVDYDLTNYKNYTTSHWGQTLEVHNVAAFCVMMSRQTYQQIGDLDERFGQGFFEDDDYCYRVKKQKLKILIADDVFVYHFGGSSFNQLSHRQTLLDQNKKLFEDKWGIIWQPHHYRT